MPSGLRPLWSSCSRRPGYSVRQLTDQQVDITHENVIGQQWVDCGHLSRPAQPDRTPMTQRLRSAITDPVILMFSRRQVETGDVAEPLALWAPGHG